MRVRPTTLRRTGSRWGRRQRWRDFGTKRGSIVEVEQVLERVGVRIPRGQMGVVVEEALFDQRQERGVITCRM